MKTFIIQLTKHAFIGHTVQERQDRFDRDALPIEMIVGKLGGRVLGRSWLARTIKVEIHPNFIPRLKQQVAVKSVSEPKKLEAEASNA